MPAVQVAPKDTPTFMAAMSLSGKTVCITGGTRGLGLELAKELVRRGSYVHVIGRSGQPFFHPNMVYHKMDLSQERPVLPVTLDIVISNLGTSVGNKRFDDMEYKEIVEMLDMNVGLHLWLLKNLKYRKFVFINSVLSQQGLPEYSMYCASKAFIHTLNQSLRREGKDTTIVYPYKINTLLFKETRDICTLDAAYVARRVLDDVEHGVKEDFIPWIFGFVNLLASVMPIFLQDALSRLVRRIFYTPCSEKGK